MQLRCSKCRQWKNVSNFQIRHERKRGYKSECNTCMKKRFDILHKYRDSLLKQLKSNGCAICGYGKCMRALEFHHINSEEKLFGLNQMQFRTRNVLSLLDEVQKCILLCSNCHKEITELGNKG